jgi:lipoyl(octanoyl) transferase
VLVEHPPVFTLGRNALPGSLLVAEDELRRRGIEVERCDRGGDVTWHGPGQVVGYPIFHLPTFRLGVASYVHALEDAMVRACGKFGVEATAGRGKIGAWAGGKKIGSVGIHVSRGVTTHGFALNACPDLAHFALINPCGMPGCPMTTIEAEAKKRVTWEDAAAAMESELRAMLGA